MRIINQTTLLLAAFALCLAPVSAQSSMTEESSSSSSSVSTSSSSSSTTLPTIDSSSASSASAAKRPADTGEFSVPSQRTSITFVPKFKQRINDLGDQIHLAQGKGFITADEAAKFLDRQSKLLGQESEVSKKGFPKPDLDVLEKAITSLNADVFAAMHKSDPVKPGSAEKEVNDPNLIPAYNDPELKPGSGHVDPK